MKFLFPEQTKAWCPYNTGLMRLESSNQAYPPLLTAVFKVRASKILGRWMPEAPITESKITMALLGDNQDLSIYTIEAVSQIS